MVYFCCDKNRRNAIKNHSTLNGIDFLEVSDNPGDPIDKRQRTLFVHFIKGIAPGLLKKENVLIEGGVRIRNIKVTDVSVGTAGSPPVDFSSVLDVEVASPGDFSAYTLRLVQDAKDKNPPAGFDPVLSAIDFSFKIACHSDFDCKTQRVCRSEPDRQPEINYLAKDYAGFRRLMLDRMSVLMPEWKEQNPADSGIALVELLAYVADHLSYRQDAVATEAYLNTARKRISVRRHARLIDYFINEGCNARSWVQIQIRSDINELLLKKRSAGIISKVLTHTPGQKFVIGHDSPEYTKALVEDSEVFEFMHDIKLFSRHNEMKFYTWGDRECCLPKGAAQATLSGAYPDLKEGDILIFIEALGPRTGEPEDADPANRHAVCLTKVNVTEDPLGGRFMDQPDDNPVPVTEIKWRRDDSLPFPLCISSRKGRVYYKDVSIALGNIVLVDHGLTEQDEFLGRVPASDPVLTKVKASEEERCEGFQTIVTLPRCRMQLDRRPLTHAASYDPKKPPVSAYAAMNWPDHGSLPAIFLKESGTSGQWEAANDLLGCGPTDKKFVVEINNDGIASIRFGDDKHGLRPASGTEFRAVYRVGNGVIGNVGAETLTHLICNDPALNTDGSIIRKVWNPLPAQGGTEPESIEQVRQNAASAMRTQERAVTPEDYAVVAQRCDRSVQRATATYRWTGSWQTVFLTVDRFGGEEVDDHYESSMQRYLERYRGAGYDLEVDGPRYVPLEIEMIICVKPEYFRGDVKAALLETFSNQIMPNGLPGVFHPDNFTFGQTIYISALYAAAQTVGGVASVEITMFKRRGAPDDEAEKSLKEGRLDMGRLEIIRLDNDPNYPEHGVLNLVLKGGR